MGTWRLLFIPLLPVVFAKFQFSIPHPEVSASLHADVLLPCTFSVRNTKNGLKFVIITWKRNGVQLAQYKDDAIQNTSRTELLITELSKGDASLLLRNVTVSDEGDYKCEVHEAPNTRSGNVSLKVTASPKVLVKPTLLLVDKENILACQAEGFYPRNISIEWLKDSSSLPKQEPLYFKDNSDGTFSAMSYYNYTPTSSELGGNLTCRVTSGSHLRHVVEIPLKICKLTINVSPKTLMHGEEEKVTCRVDGCHFSKVTVSWKRNERTFTVVHCQGTKECESEATFMMSTAEKKEVNYSCEAEIEGLGKPLIERVMLNVQGFHYHNKSFIMSDIDVPQVIVVNKEVTMTCNFSGKRWKFEKAVWRCKAEGKQWQQIQYDDSMRSARSIESIQGRRNSEEEQTGTLLSDQETSSITFKPSEANECLTFQCQVTVVSTITGRTLTKKKEAQIKVVARDTSEVT
ncbi:uncharacterized protein LOC114661806 isoform X2 [Erpetoichthys calabaricus]|uniref:uncharacterized protein LOC114661806 isoform X2 n=1 Tax=Erpetoichthys calabaricus TaxID=27687 RepID=UPI00109EF25B|nr:uncharacterized protein LOC114661806 isoform X2 [Erpetoichthys calabaricus]